MARTFKDAADVQWSARLVSHGKTSAYLSSKVHRAIVEFVRLDQNGPKRYAALPTWAEGMDDDSLRHLLKTSKTH